MIYRICEKLDIVRFLIVDFLIRTFKIYKNRPLIVCMGWASSLFARKFKITHNKHTESDDRFELENDRNFLDKVQNENNREEKEMKIKEFLVP